MGAGTVDVTNPSDATTAAVVTFNKAPSFSEDGYTLNSAVSGGTLVFSGASSALTVDLSSSSEKVTGFTKISMTTANKADKVTLTSDQIGSGEGKYSSFTGTLTDSAVDDSVVVSGESAKALDLTTLTATNVGFDFSNYSGSVTMTANQFNAATFGDNVAVTLSGSGAVNASKYVELIGESGVRLSLADDGKSLSINADANADASSEGWAITALPDSVTTLSISGTESVDLSGLTVSGLTVNLNDEDGQTVEVSSTQVLGNSKTITISGANADDTIVIDDLGNSGSSMTGNYTDLTDLGGVHIKAGALSTSMSAVYMASEEENATLEGSDGNDVLWGTTDGPTLIGGKGADYLMEGTIMYSGNEDGTGTAITGTNPVAAAAYVFCQWNSGADADAKGTTCMVESAANAFKNANIVGAFSYGSASAASLSGSEYQEITLATNENDTIVLMCGKGNVYTAPTKSLTISNFDNTNDKILLINQSNKYTATDGEELDGRECTAFLKFAGSTSSIPTETLTGDAQTAIIKVANSGALTVNNSTLTLDWGAIGSSLSGAAKAVTVNGGTKTAGDSWTDATNLTGTTTFTFDENSGVNVNNAYLEVHLTGDFEYEPSGWGLSS